MKLRFPEGFMLGVSSASTQIEGGEVGSNWNDWYHKGHIKDGSDPAVANDHWNRWREDSDAQLDRVKREMEERLEAAKKAAVHETPVVHAEAPAKMHPIIIGQNVYVMMPLGTEDSASFKRLMENDPAARERVGEPLEIPAELVEPADAPEEPVYEEPAKDGEAGK